MINFEKRKQFTLRKMIFICWGAMLGIVLVLMLSYSGIIWHNSREELLDNASL